MTRKTEHDHHLVPTSATARDGDSQPGRSTRSALLRKHEQGQPSGLVARKATETGKLGFSSAILKAGTGISNCCPITATILAELQQVLHEAD
ncbi:MAG: hypothetical protein ABI867_41325 [Kofleriaceae bacterium]